MVELDLETEELMSSIEEIAQDNLAKQQMLDDLKTDVLDRISTIVQMKMNYEELNRKHQKLSEIYDPHHIRDCLKEAALKADEDAETIAEQFLLGMSCYINTEKFLQILLLTNKFTSYISSQTRT